MKAETENQTEMTEAQILQSGYLVRKFKSFCSQSPPDANVKSLAYWTGVTPELVGQWVGGVSLPDVRQAHELQKWLVANDAFGIDDTRC